LILSNVGSIQSSAQSPERSVSVDSSRAVVPPDKKKTGLRELWAAWKRIARKIGDFQARILLTIFYFVLLAPFALLMRRTSDPLALKAQTPRGWGERQQNDPEYTVEMARKQF
jgi:hypothetical protein